VVNKQRGAGSNVLHLYVLGQCRVGVRACMFMVGEGVHIVGMINGRVLYNCDRWAKDSMSYIV
jgi:hypothetical protein